MVRDGVGGAAPPGIPPQSCQGLGGRPAPPPPRGMEAQGRPGAGVVADEVGISPPLPLLPLLPPAGLRLGAPVWLMAIDPEARTPAQGSWGDGGRGANGNCSNGPVSVLCL